jgi:hypothetical protein
MDPNEALRRIRQSADHIRKLADQEGDDTEVALAFNGIALASYVTALDGWLSGGGFLPDAWLPEQRRREIRDEAHADLLDEGIIE